MARDRAAVAMGLFFLGAGALHFLMTGTYEPMIPPWLPRPLFWVYLSGTLEMVLGAGLLVPTWRKVAGAGLAILLLAILPANIHVAVSSVALDELPYPQWYFWLRIPFQLVYVAWALWAGRLLFQSAPWASLGETRIGAEMPPESARRRGGRKA